MPKQLEPQITYQQMQLETRPIDQKIVAGAKEKTIPDPKEELSPQEKAVEGKTTSDQLKETLLREDDATIQTPTKFNDSMGVDETRQMIRSRSRPTHSTRNGMLQFH